VIWLGSQVIYSVKEVHPAKSMVLKMSRSSPLRLNGAATASLPRSAVSSHYRMTVTGQMVVTLNLPIGNERMGFFAFLLRHWTKVISLPVM
jgi:hypothetical protein